MHVVFVDRDYDGRTVDVMIYMHASDWYMLFCHL